MLFVMKYGTVIIKNKIKMSWEFLIKSWIAGTPASICLPRNTVNKEKVVKKKYHHLNLYTTQRCVLVNTDAHKKPYTHNVLK